MRVIVRRTLIASAFVVVWCALVAPGRLDRVTPGAFVRIPIEGLAIVAVALVLPRRGRIAFAAVLGVLVGLLALVNILDIGYNEELDRRFNLVIDWSSLRPAIGVLRDSVGSNWTNVVVVGAVVMSVAIVAAVTVSMIELTAVTARNRRTSARVIAALATVWVISAAFGIQFVGGSPFASRSTATLAVDQVRDTHQALTDQQKFQSTLVSHDSYAQLPASSLLTGLRGKDVLFVFVESYGQVAVQGTQFAPGVDAVLASGTKTLAAAGFDARSAWLTSPTFGGISWLAHSTLQSGLWVDNQQRYDQLVASKRFTLSDAFKKAGWRTVSDVPSDAGPWPQGTSFYHYDHEYNEHNVGYAGPKFSYAAVPDQYTMTAFEHNELQPGHAPVMAEIDLVSSHTPWTPLPHMVDPSQVGDGSIYDAMPAQGLPPSIVWQSDTHVQELYGQSIQYSLESLISFITTSNDPNLVMVMLGDHQPNTTVSGEGANHQVPIAIIAHDPTVLNQISSWNWQPGLRPNPLAPLWSMDSFRNEFLTAYDPAAHLAAGTTH